MLVSVLRDRTAGMLGHSTSLRLVTADHTASGAAWQALSGIPPIQGVAMVRLAVPSKSSITENILPSRFRPFARYRRRVNVVTAGLLSSRYGGGSAR